MVITLGAYAILPVLSQLLAQLLVSNKKVTVTLQNITYNNNNNISLFYEDDILSINLSNIWSST